MLKKGKAEKKVATIYLDQIKEMQLETVQQMRATRIRSTLKQLQEESGHLSVDQFWKIRKEVLGSVEERTSIITNDGIEVLADEAIIKEYREEFINRVSHKTIGPGYEEYQEKTNHLFCEYLRSTKDINDEPDFTTEEVSNILSNVKAGKAYPDMLPPEIFKHAGPNLAVAITKTLNTIKNSVTIPSQWNKIKIKTLYKKKGSRRMLKNHRGIFLTVIMSKVLERLLLERAQEVLKRINSLQSGSQQGKSGADTIFLTNGLIDHSIYLNKTLYITSYDFATCFDSLWLEDCLLGLRSLGVSNRIIHLLYEMNKEAEVTVKTPFGDAPPFNVKNIVKQGTVWGAKLCCASTAEICDEDVTGGASIGDLTIHSTVYVDDCNRFNTDVVDTEQAHHKFANFSTRKRAPLNSDKCTNLTINKQNHVNPPTLKIDDHILDEVKVSRILGDHFNNKGDNTSLIEKRVNLSHGIRNSMLATCNETTFGTHRIEVLVLLYRSIFVQSVLLNCRAWSRITDKDIAKLHVSQLRCLKRILRTSSSTPNTFIYLEMGVLPIEYEIHIQQLSYLHHILLLPKEDPVRRMHEQQMLYPAEDNWTNSISTLKEKYNLPTDEIIEAMSKYSWKNMVKQQVTNRAFKSLVDKCKSMSKTRSLVYQDSLQIQDYLVNYPFDVASIIFKIRGRSNNCLANRGEDGDCRLCGSGAETQCHSINCPEVCGNDDEPLSLARLYGNVPCNDKTVEVIVSRFHCFDESIRKLEAG